MADTIKFDGVDGECFETATKDDEFVFTTQPDPDEVALLLPAVCAAREAATEPEMDMTATIDAPYEAVPAEEFTLNYEEIKWEY